MEKRKRVTISIKIVASEEVWERAEKGILMKTSIRQLMTDKWITISPNF